MSCQFNKSTQQGNTLTVKKSAVARTLKEYQLYKDELSKLKNNLNTVQESGDSGEIKKTTEFYNESLSVLNDTRARLLSFIKDLEIYTTTCLTFIKSKDKVPLDCSLALEETLGYLNGISTDYPELQYAPSSH